MTDLPSKEASSTVHFASCCSDVGHMNWKMQKKKKVVSLSPHTADWTKQGFTKDKNIRGEQAIYTKKHRAVIKRPLKTEREEKMAYEKGIHKG